MSQLNLLFIDIETTGLSAKNGDKIVEIAAIETIDGIKTGREYHQYINPCRDMPEKAFEVHGLSTEFLADYPTFSEIAEDFLSFIGNDSMIVAHNGKKFDIPFINYGLKACGLPEIAESRVIDTLELAREKYHTNKGNTLDNLCERLDVDRSMRVKHGALVDTHILADVYVRLIMSDSD